jgi:DNA-directed RNA polymerase specialized sigma24 family protein
MSGYDEAAEHGEMDRAWALGVVQQAFEEVARWASAEGGDAKAGDLLRATLVEGLSLRQAATAAGMPLASASRRLAVARQRLQAAISERLRLSGDLGPDEDAAAACSVLLERLRN